MSSGESLSSSCVNRLTQLALLTKTNMGNLPSPIRSKLFNRYGNQHYQACVCSMQGYRANMEDTHLVHLSFKSHSQYSLFAIFDGHNGRKAAQYLSKNLIHKLDSLQTLTNNQQIQQLILSMDEEFCASQHGQSGSTIVFAIVKTISPTKNDSNNSLQSTHSNLSNLSTTSTVTIDDNHDSTENTYEIRVFWAGDSRALLIQNDNSFKELTCDHRPDNPSEKIRIETAKGLIINNRVDSKLAVSRAFGDCNLKNNQSLAWEKQRVTALTECRSMTAKSNDKLFLFCDGLVEYLENKQLIPMLFQHLNKYEDPVYGLGYLFDEILEGGSRDNMTAIMIHFTDANGYGNGGRQKTFLPGPLYMTRNDRKYVEAYLRNAKDFGHCDTPKLRRAAYREDLKFLRKYGARGLTQQQLQYGKTANSIITEIEQVIKEIDKRANTNTPIKAMKHETNGSTEIIGSNDDHSNSPNTNKSTPPLSEDDGEEEEKNQDDDLSFTSFNKSIHNKIIIDKTLTHISAPLKRHNSIASLTPSASPPNNKNAKHNNMNVNNKKRSFTDMNSNNMNIKEMDRDMNMNMNMNNNNNRTYSASKRRKSNIGDAVEIHVENNNNRENINSGDINNKLDID